MLTTPLTPVSCQGGVRVASPQNVVPSERNPIPPYKPESCGSARPQPCAAETAPLAFAIPRPQSETVQFAKLAGVALALNARLVFARMSRTCPGVRVGLAESIRLTIPVTYAAAALVPLTVRYSLSLKAIVGPRSEVVTIRSASTAPAPPGADSAIGLPMFA